MCVRLRPLLSYIDRFVGKFVTQFNELKLSDSILRSIREQGFDSPTEVQQLAIPAVLGGEDVLVSAQTGSGKTLAFLAPVLSQLNVNRRPNSGARGLILLPTRELALQTKKHFETLAKYTQVKCAAIIGGEAFKYQLANLRRNPEVIIATPGRMVEHLEKKSTDFQDIEYLILDEADRMIDLGFAEDMYTLIQACSKSRQSLFFSATLGHKGFREICGSLRTPRRIELAGSRTAHESIVQQRILVDDDDHRNKVLVAVLEQDLTDKAMVFCKTKAQAQKVSNVLRSNKMRADFIHGDLTQSQRKQVLNRFRDDTFKVLVATDVAARGLDIENVGMVVNYTMAHSGDEHVHRIGRTGRAGSSGTAISFVGPEDWNLMSSIERYLKFRFDERSLKGLRAKYGGPKKLKKSGKAASSIKRSKVNTKKSSSALKKSGARPKARTEPQDVGFGLIPKRKG